MIAFLSGELVESEPGQVVVAVGGMGYHVLVSDYTSRALPLPGQKVKLFTRLMAKEDELYLYGFSSREELSLFNHLINVNGVGPKGALALLSMLAPDALRAAVASENVSLLSKTPGVGKKTAQRIILELKDKFKKEYENIQLTQSTPAGERAYTEEAVEALIHLGYRQQEARVAVAKAMEKADGELDLAELVRRSLKLLDSI